MAKDFLLEVGLEEMPAHVVTFAMQQFEKKVVTFLEEQALEYREVEAFSTPRRFGVKILEVAEKQADVHEEVKGPAKKIALDAAGNWSKAAEGFVRGQGVTTEDITFREIKGVEYVYVNKFVAGKPAAEVLLGLTDVITSMTFPVSMHWASYDFKYIRPIHWLVALLGSEILPLEILDVKAGRLSRGHRFLGEAVEIANAQAYDATMKAEFVVTSPLERKKMIETQVAELAQQHHFKVDLDADLLEEVNNLVEYPTVFVGRFDEKYLSVPEEVLVTSMKEHQRYFEVRNEEGLLLPHFIAVRNGDRVHLENVVKGNEKVLTARLEDAEFFYREDQKLAIEDCVNKLKHVTFHEKIGTIYEKMQRVAIIAEIVGQKVGLNADDLLALRRASEIYKFDLVTNMVGEFPELQGLMGEKYAKLQGETPAVATAIREHYMPISAEGDLPQTDIGAVLAVSDKLDSLLSFFSVGLIPSGSNDPYALRRQTYGLIRILEAKNWGLSLSDLQAEIAAKIQSVDLGSDFKLAPNQTEVTAFVMGRLKQYLAAHGIRHDVVEAVTQGTATNLAAIFATAEVLTSHLEDADFKASVEALTRVMNLATKGQAAYGDAVVVQPELFENAAEQALYQATEACAGSFDQQTMSEKYRILTNLKDPINKYFEDTMVMAKEEAVKRNRLAQLIKIAKMATSFAAFDQLLVK